MTANAIRTALIALLLAGGLSMACRLTASAAPAPAQVTNAPAASVCQLGSAC
jgi:hypothetical protein